jgi:hypothetical protein
MSQRLIKYTGKIVFDPEERTRKHQLQSSWKKIAMIVFDGDITDYYAWYVNKRYNLELNKPLRGAHISFVNDSIRDINGGLESVSHRETMWNDVKRKWNGKYIDVILDVSARTDSKHWWLNVPIECQDELMSIRGECGLGKPYWSLHMSIGYANERNIDHSDYIHRMIKLGLITT